MPRLSKIGAAALAAFGWTSGSAVTASYLQVAGGGGGGFIAGGNRGAGGGAGGFLTGTVSLNPTLSYTVTVGAGGTPLANGSNSQFGALTASVGGGAGGSQNGASSVVGQNGGSGGGGPSQSGSGSTAGGTGTAGQGNNGAAGSNVSGQPYGCGGGGGAGGAGSLSNNPAGAGGVGLANPISGSTVGQLDSGTYYLAGGGGGGTYAAGGGVGGAGGLGGGGLGGGTTSANGVSGTANTGGGGGGAEYSSSAGANGGSGVVIISYVGAQQFGGGVVTSSGGNTIHTFNTSGTLSPLNSLTASYLVVAGGGSGGTDHGGGGGAGGMLSGSGLTIDTNSIYAVTVGAGGASPAYTTAGNNGSNSVFYSITSTGGGCGGGGSHNAGNGGSGGGARPYSPYNVVGTGISGQGNNGGTSSSNETTHREGGGGGGASAVGQNSNLSTGAAGNGGAGSEYPTSSGIYYAGGGGGGCSAGFATGTGGTGGGGNGASGSSNGSNGETNKGGGGGGSGGVSASAGGAGGSGIVIISYPGTTQQMAGGTVTVAGGNVIHTFTSSGYLTPIVLANNSLRFRSSASAYLNRTPASAATSRRIMTYSVWAKIGTLGTQRLFYEGYTSVSDFEGLVFNTSNQLEWTAQVNGGTSYGVRTPAVFRDPSAWYHIVCAVDTTQATDTNRVRIYVNGVEQTGLTTFYSGFPAQNTDLEWNNQSSTQVIGWGGHFGYYDGYMTEINMIDGQALTPNSFGTSNSLGVWQPIRYGGSYGTNGFYLPFTGETTFAGSFNGTSQYLSVAGLTPNWSTYGNWTAEAWVYITDWSSASPAPIFGTGGSGNSIGYIYSSGIIAFGINGTNEFTSASGLVTSGKWNHVAFVRNGTAINIYLNGVSVASTSSASTYLSNTSNALQIGFSNSPYYLKGYISNFRFTNTVVYSGNFTPTTTALTAIAGTQLLTCQSSTFIDNSTNAYAITNNGTATIAQQIPFNFLNGQAKDNGPAGNNWTTNNIGYLSGSTLDSMTDVPTLTSATAANYAVLNPLAMYGTNAVISNANLTSSATSTSNDRGWASTIAAPNSGKWYAEFTFTSTNSDNNGGCGIMLENGTGVPGESATTVSWRDFGTLRQNASSTSYGSALVANDVVIVAYDAALGRVWFGKNGTWFASGDPATNANPSATGITTTGRFATYHYNTTAVIQANFGQRPFAYTPPTDFKALNTFNLTTPAIGATASTLASQNFNAVLYSGNNSTQTITVGFQPDFMWSKCTNSGRSHRLIDSVRGLSYQSFSDSVDGGNTYDATSYVSSITSTSSSGFAITNGGTDQYNTSGENYVSWTWKANGTAVTNTAGSIISSVSSNTTAGFSIVTYTGNATSGATVGHGCQVGGIATAPSMVILKGRSISTNWYVYHSGLTSASYQVYLNLPNQEDNAVTTAFNSVAPGATTFTLPGTGFGSNNSGERYVAYCFAQVAGYSAFGTYIGNNDDNGPFIYTGFRPRWVMVKNRTSSQSWQLMDTSRSTYNVATANLLPNSATQQLTGTDFIDILSNGFKIRRNSAGNWNNSGDTYLYVCFAENPFKYANAR